MSVEKNKSNPKKKKWLRRIFRFVFIIFILLNVVAAFHAYKFTHFVSGLDNEKITPENISNNQKLKMMFFGLDVPRPENDFTPLNNYDTIHLKSNVDLECWEMNIPNAKGTVILFHGFSGSKSSLIEKANIFREFGYNTLLVDFMGSGGSAGNQTTIGYFEAEEVKTCFDYIAKKETKNIFLFGTSMGAVAIMKALYDSPIEPSGIILECPFGSMYQTVCARFNIMDVSTFPMAGLLVFWGGTLNGFWAFGHNPTEYAKEINCPTLLLYGGQDDKVSASEIQEIYTHLPCEKKQITYPEAGHDNYLQLYRKEWTDDVSSFLSKETDKR